MAQGSPTRTDRAVALRGSHLLSDFTDVGVKILAEIASQRSVGKGTYAFKAGEASATLSFVAKGTLQLVPRDGGAVLGEVVSRDTVEDWRCSSMASTSFPPWPRTTWNCWS